MSKPPRNRNRFAQDRLWDEEGREWLRTASDLSRIEVEAVLAQPTVRVGVHEDFGQPIRWVAPEQRQVIWRDEVARNFADGGLRVEHAKRSGRLPYTASLWTAAGQRLLIFESD